MDKSMVASLPNVTNSKGVNSITQSSTTTSTDHKFKCQTNKNPNGCQLFPLAENCENTQTMSWHNLLKHLKSQRFEKNCDLYKNFTSKQNHNSNTHQQFPLAQRYKQIMKDFPFSHLRYDHVKRNETKWKKGKFPLKLDGEKKTFPYNSTGLKRKSAKDFKDKSFKIRQLNSNLKHCCYLKCTLRKLPIDTNLKSFPLRQANVETNKKFPLQNNYHPLYRNNAKELKFPLKLLKNNGKFPFVNKFQNKINLFSTNCKQQHQFELISRLLQNVKTYKDPNENQNLNVKFPCQLLPLRSVSKFPINNHFTQHEHSFNENNLGNCDKENMFKYPKTSNSLPSSSSSSSLSMTQSDQEMKNISNEHVLLQVQDAQAEENPRSFLATNENKHPPPQTEKASRACDDDVIILASDINSINNTRPNQVGYYAEKIELLQNIIVALFEKIQNVLTKNHNNNNNNAEDESTNAAKYDHGDDNNRFALTPPMSVTSVRNISESTNHNKEVLCKKYDLGDLGDHQVGQIVECSDVRDTLAEAVDYGVTTKEKTKNTGSFLVKSEEPVSPNSPITPNPLNESEQTSSHKDYSNASEILANNNVLTVNEGINVDVKYNLKLASNNIIVTHETVTNTREIAKESEMTVSRLKKKEEENTQEIKSSIINDNILYDDNEISEMKYEMNRVKTSLPSSVSERSVGKHDNLKTGTNSTRLSNETPLSNNNNRLSHTFTSTRNPNESFYAHRSSLKNDNSSLGSAVPKRSTIPSTHLRQDGITNLSAVNTHSLNETTSKRAPLKSAKPSYDSSGGDALAHRRPPLGSLRSNQSTALLSVDLSHCAPLPALGPTDKTTLANHRAFSTDSSVLPERTRLRRQRRFRPHDSKDDLEDPVERLNLLKARISASLSEVKGVLKQYSTETENDNEDQTANAANRGNEIKEEGEQKKDGPITFRFVKKIRRRSLFTEDDEPEQKKADTNTEPSRQQTDDHKEKQLQTKDETDNCNLKAELILPSQCAETPIGQPLEVKGVDKQPLAETNEIEINTSLYTLKELTHECESEHRKTAEEPKTSDDAKGAIPKPTLKHEAKKLENTTTQDTSKKMKRKIIIKSKESLRRASLAAVEGSKIEPPVSLLAIPAKMQRRTSDSEAMVKGKLITDKLNTSGVVEEVTPKPKILKLKISSTKINNNSQLATEQTKLKDAEAIANAKTDNLIKSTEKGDNKSIHTDKTKDILLPKQPEAEIQQQINSQPNVLLMPTQLVIDEVASSNEKTIKNSMLPPRQLMQQKQHLQQLEEDKQATINTTATKFISSDLQAKGAMLENVSTVLSSPAASEANGQIKRDHHVEQQEDFHDLLQQATTIIKPSTVNKQNELKLVKDSDQSNTKNTNSEIVNGNLESVQTTTKEQQQQQQQLQTPPTQHQQVIATVDVAHAKNSDDTSNNHEDTKAKESLKEPCKDKTRTSSHIGTERQQRTEEQFITNIDDIKTISSTHNSISCTTDGTHKTTTTTASQLPSETVVEKKPEPPSANQQQNAMPEFKLVPAPVQTADIRSHPELHQKKIILNKKFVRQTSTDKTKKAELDKTKSSQETQQIEIVKPASDKNQPLQTQVTHEHVSDTKPTQEDPAQQDTIEIPSQLDQEQLIEECSESPEILESSTSIGSEELTATQTPKKERRVKKKVIIRRQKRRLSISDSFFQTGSIDEQHNAEIETLEKPIAYVTDDEAEQSDEKNEDKDKDDQQDNQEDEEQKPLKSCILHKEYNIGDEVLYAERFKKTQIKWRRGRVKERITSISYLLDIDGKDVSSHINYLKRFTGRKVSFGGKEYLEIDYEQLAEEEEKAERLQRRTYSIWNMV